MTIGRHEAPRAGGVIVRHNYHMQVRYERKRATWVIDARKSMGQTNFVVALTNELHTTEGL